MGYSCLIAFQIHILYNTFRGRHYYKHFLFSLTCLHVLICIVTLISFQGLDTIGKLLDYFLSVMSKWLDYFLLWILCRGWSGGFEYYMHILLLQRIGVPFLTGTSSSWQPHVTPIPRLLAPSSGSIDTVPLMCRHLHTDTLKQKSYNIYLITFILWQFHTFFVINHCLEHPRTDTCSVGCWVCTGMNFKKTMHLIGAR